MRCFVYSLLGVFVFSPALAQEDNPIDDLGQALVEAIAADDVVAYSQCWLSQREGLAYMKGLGLTREATELEKQRDYIIKRDRQIAESFLRIQEHIKMSGVDRSKIQFESCEAQGVREREAPQGKAKRANEFTVVFEVEEEKWQIRIDDGVLVNDLWYFSDSPISLDAGGKIIRITSPPTKSKEATDP